MKRTLLAIGAIALSSTPPVQAQGHTPTSAGIAKASHGSLSDFLGCLRREKIAVVVAHRGGPFAEHPENAIVTFEHNTALAPMMIETDIQQTIDEVLFQQHDGEMERSTTGQGSINNLFSMEMAQVRQLDPMAVPTSYKPARTSDVLNWSRGKAVLLLDIKPRTDAALVAREVKSAKLEGSVMAIAYTPRRAMEIRRLLPEAVLTLAITTADGFAEARAAGLLDARTAAFIPPGPPGEAMARALEAAGTTPIALSYGGVDSPDAIYRSLEDAGQYQRLADAGARLIVSNRPLDAARALMAQPGYATKLAKCGVAD